MNKRDRRRTSKLLSLVLRHQPELAGVELDAQGWTDVPAILTGLRNLGCQTSPAGLAELAASGDKQRFELSPDGKRIRAVYGHSVEMHPGIKPSAPPEILFHGTALGNLASVMKKGLVRGKRVFVHLSETPEMAISVGRRHGQPVLLIVRAREMHGRGHVFYAVPGGIWLVTHVPSEFVETE